MKGWFGVVEIVLIVLVLLILPLIILALRRRWLSRSGGTFECSLRLRTTTPGTGWVLGVARYSGEQLEWFRVFSFSFRPRKTFRRGDVVVLENRAPDAIEAVSLYAGQRVVRMEEGTDADGQLWDAAMSSDSLTGLLSWLEAAPPGVAGY